MLAGHDFQEGLKNYRDLVYMGGTLERWDGDMVAFKDMIDTREAAFAERLPRADALLASGAVGTLQQRDVALENRLRTIEAQHDVAALGTTAERQQWARIQRVEAAMAGTPDTPESAELHARLALVRGVLQFRLNEAFGDTALRRAHAQPQGLVWRWERGAEPAGSTRATAAENVPAITGELLRA